MNIEAKKQQLEAIRRQLAAMDAQVESVLFSLESEEQVVPAPDTECDHPRDARRNLTTMGGPERWECLECEFVYDESEEMEGDE